MFMRLILKTYDFTFRFFVRSVSRVAKHDQAWRVSINSMEENGLLIFVEQMI